MRGNTLPSRRPLGRSLAAMHPPRIETRQAIHARAVALRNVRDAVRYGNPARGQSSYAGATVATNDRVENPRPHQFKQRKRRT